MLSNVVSILSQLLFFVPELNMRPCNLEYLTFLSVTCTCVTGMLCSVMQVTFCSVDSLLMSLICHWQLTFTKSAKYFSFSYLTQITFSDVLA